MSKKYVSNKDETVRMFKNELLESLSRVHWTVPIWFFIPIISFYIYRSIFFFQLEVITIVLFIVLGIIIWTITEYLLHRFIFHYMPTSGLGKRLHFLFHGVHHDYPKDSKRLVMPPSISIPLAVFFYYMFDIIIGSVFVSPFFAGFLAGYLFYDITHYAIHHFNMKSKFWLAIKNHHMLHHYKFDDKGFGVSQPFWDYVFNTTYPDKENN